MRIEFQIEGFQELDRKLTLLPKKVAGKVVRSAVRNAQKIALAACQTAARALPKAERNLYAVGREDVSMSELIARNLEIRAPRRQQPHSYSLHVQMKRRVEQFWYYARGARTILKGAGKPGKIVGVSYIPAAIEFGHGSNKEAAARPFMRRGADASAKQVMAQVAAELGQGIEQAAQEKT